MAGNTNLSAAKSAKNDEFYTQYSDIEAEINAYVEYNPDVFRDKTILCPCDDPEWSNFTKYFAENFECFGLKKLIGTSYAHTHGKLFTMTCDKDGFGCVDTDGIKVSGYLKGNGDFRSNEVTALRDEANVIITNPPFSLFREFLAWIMAADKQFVIVGNKNAITYKEVFPLLKNDKVWLGCTSPKEFIAPTQSDNRKNTHVRDDGTVVTTFGNICWFTNVDHGLRHQPLLLDTMEHNLKSNKKLRRKFKMDEMDYGKLEYPRYDNYDAIEVPFVEAIPSDYDGVMGVPITFLDKYNPAQFEIISTSRDAPGYTGMRKEFLDDYFAQGGTGSMSPGHPDLGYYTADGKAVVPYRRILIRSKRGETA